MKELSRDILREFLTYDPSTGIFRWRISNSNRVRQGAIAGSSQESGYHLIRFRRKLYKAHRLAFLYMIGSIPAYVDHINGDKLDNSWDNLRECTVCENQQNRKISTANTSGVKGVSRCSDTKSWQVRLQLDGVNKYFGSFKTIAEAEELVKNIREQLHGEFARHK